MQALAPRNPRGRKADAEDAPANSLARRLNVPRIVGTALAAPCIGAALLQHGTAPWAWLVLALHAIAWPHLAYRWASSAASPRLAEYRNLIADAALGGFWIAAAGGNLLLAVLLLETLGTGVFALGGGRLALQALLAMSTGVVLGLGLLAPHFEPRPELQVVIASIPLLVAYPVLFGLTTFRLTRELERQKAVLRTLHEHDVLSGLGSRAWLNDRLREEFERFRRYQRPVALLLLDVDHFKSINDSLGHTAGDEAIRLLGALLKKEVRRGDMAGRYGGEEFAVILPETDAGGALVLAERLRASIAAREFPIGRDGLRMTISCGVAAQPPASDHAVAWVERADRALYRAKNEGRNQVRADHEEADAGQVPGTGHPPEAGPRQDAGRASASRTRLPVPDGADRRLRSAGAARPARRRCANETFPQTTQTGSGRPPRGSDSS